MSDKKQRMALGVVIWVTRLIGFALIVIAVMGLPQLRPLTGRLAVTFGSLTSIALGLAGLVWLVGIELFIRFFDRYLSRN